MQPLHRAGAERGDAVLDFLHLLGGVNVDRPVRTGRHHLRQGLRRHRAQRMRRDADTCRGQCGDDVLRPCDQLEEAIDVVEEALLPRRRRRIVEATGHIERGQQRQADAGGNCRGRDAPGKFAEIAIRLTGRIMVQIVEFGHRGETGFQHLHVGEGGDGIDVLRRKPRQKAVHHLPPGPEAVARRPAPLGEAGHGALEGMAVQIGQAGHGDAGVALRALGVPLPLDRADHAVFHRDADMAGPAVRQQRMLEEQGAGHAGLSSHLNPE